MFAHREAIGELRNLFLMLQIHEQEPLQCSCETMYRFYDFGHRNAAGFRMIHVRINEGDSQELVYDAFSSSTT